MHLRYKSTRCPETGPLRSQLGVGSHLGNPRVGQPKGHHLGNPVSTEAARVEAPEAVTEKTDGVLTCNEATKWKLHYL